MRRSAMRGGVLLLLAAVLSGAAAADEVRLEACQPMTLASGEISGWGNDIPFFLGEDRLFRDAASWAAFWVAHDGIYYPPAPVPPVDFDREVVIAVVQGHQPSGGAASITVDGLTHSVVRSPATATPGVSAIVRVVDDERQGDLTVITNPYHFSVVPRRCVPGRAGVSFRHEAPPPGSGVIRGRVWLPAADGDWHPAPGVQVQLHGPDPTPPQASVTGRDGSYFFLRVPPGGYLLTVAMPGLPGETVELTVTQDAILHHDFRVGALP
ncbi:MAG: carboxypeptidase-like regulatory domain-containing protein [Acidobacteriota bacterium]